MQFAFLMKKLKINTFLIILVSAAPKFPTEKLLYPQISDSKVGTS